MSEMRRAARSLVERRSERFESRHDLATSRQRLDASLRRAGIERDATFELAWSEADGKAMLDVHFLPTRRIRRFLQMLSVGMVALVALSVWVLRRADEGAQRFLLPLFTVLAILALPFVTLGLASSRAAQEARIRRAIRIALLDEEERFPPQQTWADED